MAEIKGTLSDEVIPTITANRLKHLAVFDTDYIAPTDGYFTIHCENIVGNYAVGAVNGHNLMQIHVTSSNYHLNSAVFVRKGMTLRIESNHLQDGNSWGIFRSLY